jgi:hypothetical protein
MMHTYDRQMGGIMKYKWKTVDQKKWNVENICNDQQWESL